MFDAFKRLFGQPPIELVLAHNKAKSNFYYVAQPNEWVNGTRKFTIHDIHAPFQGDCDDWAASLVMELKGDAKYVEFFLPYGTLHAVCLYKGWVSDNLRKAPYRAEEIKSFRFAADCSVVNRLASK